MAFWSPSSITPINQGADPGNLGDGDTIRNAFTYVEDNFTAISNQLASVNQDFLNANVTNDLIAGTITTGNLSVNNVTNSPTFYSNINLAAHIIPVGDGLYDLGSASNRLRKVWSYATDTATQIQSSSDAGLLIVHANASVGDTQDTGIFGNITSDYASHANTYCFFGHQFTTNDFVYKITNTDATKGNNVVYDGIYGNVHFGSAFLSNTTNATSNVTGALIVSGGISSNADVRVRGNVWSGGFKTLTTADVNNLGYPTYNGAGSLFVGNTVFATTTPSTTTTTGAVVVLGGVGVGGNVVAGGYLGDYFGNIRKPEQPFITTVGSLGNLTVVGTTSTSSLQATSIGATSILSELISATTVSATTVTATTVNATTSIVTTSNATTVNATTINTSGLNATTSIVTPIANATAVNSSTINATTSVSTPIVNATTVNATTVNATTVGSSSTILVGTLANASQPNVTSLGTLANLTVSGNTAINNTLYARGVYDNSVRVVSTSSNSGNLTISNGAINLTPIGPGATTVGSATAVPIITTDTFGRITSLTSASISTTLNITGTAGSGSVPMLTQSLIFAGSNGVTATASGNTITVGIPQAIATTSTPTFAGMIVGGSIVPNANLTYNVGSTTQWFNTFYGVSTQAKYADLAENYRADRAYEPGTVVVFGGNEEVTTTAEFADARVAGAVSTEPAHLMNGGLTGDNVVALALRGRVPCKVLGPVQKGDLLVTAGARPGFAISVGTDRLYSLSVFAKALETNLSAGEKVIEVVIL